MGALPDFQIIGLSLSTANDTSGLKDKIEVAPIADESTVMTSLREMADNSEDALEVNFRPFPFMNP